MLFWFNVLDINECLSDPCQNGGECIDTTYDFMCLCEHDFTGHICQSGMYYCPVWKFIDTEHFLSIYNVNLNNRFYPFLET